MDLKETLLEDVFRGSAISEESHQEVEQLALVAFNQLSERGLIAVAIRFQKLLVGDGGDCRRRLAVAAALVSVVAIVRGWSLGGAQRLFLFFVWLEFAGETPICTI